MPTSQESTQNWEHALSTLDLRERVILGNIASFALRTDPKHLLFSLARYKHTARLLPFQSVQVLELGCGEGFFTQILAQSGHTITGVDSNSIAIQQAATLPGNCTFICDSFLGKQYGSFAAVVSLDVIEHIPQEIEAQFMDTICANLLPTGMCVIGTPNESSFQYASDISKMSHINNYSAQRLYETVAKYFHNVIILCMNDEVLHTGFYPMAHYLLAVGFNKKEI